MAKWLNGFMTIWLLITTVISIHILAWLTPGPLFVLIVRNSLVYSRKTGLWTAVGIMTGNFIHILYSVTGIALLISTYGVLFNVIKYLGVGYLLYLGLKTFKASHSTEVTRDKEEHQKADLSKFEAFRTGFITNILSPKASLFFAGIFASVFSAGAPMWVVIFLMIAMPINSFVMASILSVFFTQGRIRSVYSRYQLQVNRGLGLLLVGLAGMILLK